MKTLLEVLQSIPDPRSRRGRIYPLYGLLAVLLLAAMHGERSLLGMWQWGKAREKVLVHNESLGLWVRGLFASLASFWQVLRKLDAGVLERAFREWVMGWGEEAWAIDGKTLRGSKREGERAIQVITMAGQRMGGIVGQRLVEGGNELAAALQLLEEVPIEGKVIGADAGLLKTPLVQKVVEKGGLTLGS